MNQRDIDERWFAREPIEGVAFLLNDSVRVVAGPHTGVPGAVISLIEASPPLYLVELYDGTELRLPQTDIVAATARDSGAVVRLQRWYSSQCDGDWEHGLGVRIETLDNPGWLVKIDLRDTPLEGRPFDHVRIDDEREWIDCRVVDEVFCGAGGPHMLGAIIEEVLRWAEPEGAVEL
jgi:hypothetical protein